MKLLAIRMLLFAGVSVFCGCSADRPAAIGYIPVKLGEKWGYTDREGKFIVNPQFDYACDFRDGRGLVMLDKKWGFIDTKGNVTGEVVYEYALPFSEGVAWTVVPAGAPVLTDTHGEARLEMKAAKWVGSFSEGLAAVKVDSTGKYGFIDKDGEWKINPEFGGAAAFHEGMAAVVAWQGPDGRNVSSKRGYVDKSGKLVIGYRFDYACNFKPNGTAVVAVNGDNGLPRYGLVDKKGDWLITPQFDFLKADGDWYQCRFVGGDTYGWCDSHGKMVINPQFKDIDCFDGGELAPASLDGKTYGFIDRTGKMVIAPQFDWASSFADGLAIVRQAEMYGFIGEDGRYAVNPQFSGVDTDVLRYFNGRVPDTGLESEFFDTETFASALKSYVTDAGMLGLLDSGIGTILKDRGMDSSAVDTGKAVVTIISEERSLPHASMDVSVSGDFHEQVSDGWWDYVYRLSPGRKPSELRFVVLVDRGKSSGYGKLFTDVKKAFGAKGRGVSEATAYVGGHSVAMEFDDGMLTVVVGKK